MSAHDIYGTLVDLDVLFARRDSARNIIGARLGDSDAGVVTENSVSFSERLVTSKGSAIAKESDRFNLLRRAKKFISLVPSFLGSIDSTRPRGFPVLAWVSGRNTVVGAIRSRVGYIYVAMTSGVCGVTGPSHTSGSVSDGGVTWRYLGTDPHQWQANFDYSAAGYGIGTYINNLGSMYILLTPGISAGATGPNTNSSDITDNAAHWCRVQQRWVDTVRGVGTNGTGGNDGLSHLTPWGNLYNASGSATTHYSANDNTHYWIAAGSHFEGNCDNTMTQYGVISMSQGFTSLTVYDPVTGNEILDQPNIFSRALDLQWVTETEKRTKYFSVTCNARGRSSDDYTGTKGGGITGGGFGGATKSGKVRGAYIYDCAYGALNVGGNPTNTTYEDIIIEDTYTPAGVETGEGVGITCSAGTASGMLLRNIGVAGSGIDGIWLSADPGPTNFTMQDIVILQAPTNKSNTQHADGLQMGKYCGTSTINRMIIDHDMSGVSYTDAVSDPIGSAFITEDSGSSGSFSLTMRDCIICSNSTTLNLWTNAIPGIYNSLLYTERPASNPVRVTGLRYNTAGTLTDCVEVRAGLLFVDAVTSGITPTIAGSGRIVRA